MPLVVAGLRGVSERWKGGSRPFRIGFEVGLCPLVPPLIFVVVLWREDRLFGVVVSPVVLVLLCQQ